MKYKCIEEVYSYALGDVIREGEIIKAEEEIVCGSKRYNLFSKNGLCIGVITDSCMNTYFTPYIEEQEECTVTTEPTREVFKGYDIIRLASEGKLKDKTMIINVKSGDRYIYTDKFIRDVDGNYDIGIYQFIEHEFEIYEPKIRLISYKEAVENNSMIRHKDWDDSLKHTTVHNVLSFYTKERNKDISNDLLSDEKCWEVEQ